LGQTDRSADQPTGNRAERTYRRAAWVLCLLVFATVSVLASSVTAGLHWGWCLPGVALTVVLLLVGRFLLLRRREPKAAAWLAVAVAGALALRVGLAVSLPYKPCLDFRVYHDSGLLMAQSWKLAVPAGENSATYRCFFPPGQVFSLGVLYRLFDGKVLAPQLLNAVYGALTVAGAWYLARRMFGATAAITAALLAAAMPSAVLGCALIGAEAPESFWLVLAVCFYVGAVEARLSRRAAVLCGLCLGVASLIRPTFVLLPAVLAAHLVVVSQSRVKAAVRGALMVAGLAAVVLPWTYRNYLVTGGFILISSNGGGNLYSANNDQAKGDYTDSAWQYVYDNGLDDLALQRVGFGMAKQWIAEHPLEFAKLAVRKFGLFWWTDKDIGWWATIQPSSEHPELGVPRAVGELAEGSSSGFYSACFVAATVCLWRRRRELLNSTGWLVCAPVFLYFTALHMVFEAQAKYHFMLMPLLCVLVSLAAAGPMPAGPLKHTGLAKRIEHAES